jgi:hypothetical protein
VCFPSSVHLAMPLQGRAHTIEWFSEIGSDGGHVHFHGRLRASVMCGNYVAITKSSRIPCKKR